MSEFRAGPGGVRRLAWPAALVAGLGASIPVGCADESLGVGPYRTLPDQPIFPIGMTRVPALDPERDGGPNDLLLVSSTNMDQRFNAGKLDAYDLSALDELIECRIANRSDPDPMAPAMVRRLSFSPEYIEAHDGEPEGEPLDPCAAAAAGSVWRAGVSTLAGGGYIDTVRVAVREQAGADPVERDFVALPTRFDQALTFVQVRTDGNLAPNGLDTDDFEVGRREDRDDPNAIEYRPAVALGDDTQVPYLACRYGGPDGGEPSRGVTSCSETFTVILGVDDPFSVAVTSSATSEGPGEGILIGHLRPDRSGVLGLISELNPDELGLRLSRFPDFEALPDQCSRLRGDLIQKGFTPLAFSAVQVDSVSFLAPTPALSGQRPGLFVASNRRIDTVLNVVGLTDEAIETEICESFTRDFRPTAFDETPILATVQPELSLDVRAVTFGNTIRGLTYGPPTTPGGEGRLWLAVRTQEQIDSDTSALLTIAHDPTPEAGEDELRILSTFPLGEELGRLASSPFAPPGRRWLYALDARSDQIFVLDVTDDQPVILNRIEGRYLEPDVDGIAGNDILRFTLATPLEAVFDRRAGRKRMYVTNFENSTLAVIDVTSDDPREHRLVARVGVDRNTADRQEGQDDFFRDDR